MKTPKATYKNHNPPNKQEKSTRIKRALNIENLNLILTIENLK